LQQLTWLQLSSNKFTEFPQVLLKLGLEVKWDSYKDGICIKDNPFAVPPVEIVKQGRPAIIDYFAALEEQKPEPQIPLPDPISNIPVKKAKPQISIPDPVSDIPANTVAASASIKKVQQSVYLNESKLILIGDGAAGKTSLMKRLLKQKFDPQESQTHGINIDSFNITDPQGQEIKLHCWDFGGQQIMHTTHQFFLSKRCLYLLVIDSRRESHVAYWLQHINSFGYQAPVIIVINKIDENPHFDLLQQRQLRQDYPNLKQICRISCATGAGLPELHQAIQQTLPAIELLHTKFPQTWWQVKTELSNQAQQNNFSSYEHYVELCAKYGIQQESAQNTLINFLHDLGLIIHFADPRLRETTVINPRWITEAVYRIITAPALAQNGKLHRNNLQTLLDPQIYPERKHDYILELMCRFELCYAVNQQEYLLPDLFPTQEPPINFNADQALRFILDYEFLPAAIFTRFIVKMQHQIVADSYWRSGVLLQDTSTDSTALVETDTVNNRISIQITSTQQREYLSILLFVFHDLQRNFHALKVTEKISLPDNPQLNVSYEYLQTIAKDGDKFYRPPEDPGKKYAIAELLGLVTPQLDEMQMMLIKIIKMLENQGFSEEKDIIDHIDDVVKVNLGIGSFNVDMNALLRKWRQRKG